MGYFSQNRLFYRCFWFAGLVLFVVEAWCAQYTRVVLDSYFNAPHTTYFRTFFTSENINIDGIPFLIKLSGNNTIMTPLQGPGVVTIPIRRGPSNIYILGFGTFISRDFGHKDLYCDSIDHFSITLGYVDGTREEKFPIDARLGLPQWSDILRAEGAVAHFEGGYIHMYKVPVGGRELEYISINDKYGGLASYWIIAITLEYVDEQVPSRTQTLLQWTLDPSVLEANKLTVVKIDGYLRRADTNAGLADKPIFIELPGVPRIELRTDGSGYFGLRHGLQLPEGTYRVTISFPGDALFQPVTDSRELRVVRPSTQGSLAVFDLDYKGTPPNSDGNNQTSVTVAPGSTLTIFFRYNEGNAGNQYVIRVYGEWDKNTFLANSDNDEQISEIGAEIGGYRWDKEVYTVPNTPGTYKVRVVYNASVTPPTWDRYERLLAEGSVTVTQPQPKVKTTLEWTLEPSVLEPNKLTTIRIDGYLRRADTNAGLAGKKIFIQLPGEPLIDVPTNQNGQFGLVYGLRLAEGVYQVTVSFPGDEYFQPATISRELRVSRQYNINISILDVFSKFTPSDPQVCWITAVLSISGLPDKLQGWVYITINGRQRYIKETFSNGTSMLFFGILLETCPASINVSIEKVVFDEIGTSVTLHWQGIWNYSTIAQIIDQAWGFVKQFPDIFKQEKGEAIPKPTNIQYPFPVTIYIGPLDKIGVRCFDVANYRALLHELGHYIEDKWYLFNMGSEHSGPSNEACDKWGRKFALKEGWAEFFANLVIYEYLRKPYLAEFNLENPFQYCQFALGNDNDQWALGVAGILWDLYDAGDNENFDKISIPPDRLLAIIKKSMAGDSQGLPTLYQNLIKEFPEEKSKIQTLLKEGYGIEYEPSSEPSPIVPGERRSNTYGSASGWYLVSVPTTGDTASVFGTPLYHWNGNSYETFSGNASIEPTKGYWAKLPANKTVTVSGDIPQRDQERSLNPAGWHMVSVPWNYPKSAIRVARGSEMKTWAEAVAAGWVADEIWFYNAEKKQYESATALHPWYGYWVKTSVENVTLKFLYEAKIGTSCVACLETSSQEIMVSDTPPPPPREIQEIQFINVPNPITSTHTTTFKVVGPISTFVTEIRVQVFDLTGRLVWEGTTNGSELTWHTEGLDGYYLANGVYLYKIYAKVEDTWITSDLLKLVINR